MAALDELTKRIQTLEDLEAIKKMKAYYGHLCDERYGKDQDEINVLAQQLTGLFTEDGVWDSGKVSGVRRGRKEIYEYFTKPAFNFGLHYFVKPDISISGNNAKGRWYLWMPGTTKENQPFWMAGYEDDEYVKIDGQWLHSHMNLFVHFLTPYEEGWVKKQFFG